MNHDDVHAIESGLSILDALDNVTSYNDAYRVVGLIGSVIYTTNPSIRSLSTTGSMICILAAAERNNMSLAQTVNDIRVKYLQEAELMMG